jgi:hypothetical protein
MSYNTWGMNNRPSGGRSSETESHSIDMNDKGKNCNEHKGIKCNTRTKERHESKIIRRKILEIEDTVIWTCVRI